MTALTFVVPVRHQDNARDWGQLKAKLAETLASIANQTHPDWRCVVVANEGADLPALPDKVSALRVTFPPNPMHEMGTATQDAVLDMFRADKGRRVLSGMLAARDSRFFMIVDDDDMVSARLTQFIADHPDASGWYVADGFLWEDGGSYLFPVPNLNGMCGTSLIVRADLYDLPDRFEEADIEWIKDALGSHQRIGPMLAARGAPLARLPFPGAVYRVGNAGSHSKVPGLMAMIRRLYWRRRRPDRFLRKLLTLKKISAPERAEFFGGQAPRASARHRENIAKGDGSPHT